MNAVGFINKFGWLGASDLWEGDFDLFSNDTQVLNGMVCSYSSTTYLFSLLELKQYLDAFSLVESYGGLEAARQEAHKDCFVYNKELLAACYLVNQCS